MIWANSALLEWLVSRRRDMSSKRKKRDKEYHERQIKRDQKIIESRRYNGAMAIGDIEQMAKVMRCR